MVLPKNFQMDIHEIATERMDYTLIEITREQDDAAL